MTALDVARWQFGITTVYHFIFVPLTIGLSILVAGMQTAWHVRKNPVYLRMTKFFGKLFLINFAIGVVTGIVQEFQFGMNWSDYSRFVGDVFGAPLAMEGLLAFFLESTFLGLWIFGWDKLSPRLHLATIWLAALGTNLSAYFILAANSWMQHPVGYRLNPVTHRAELTSITKVLTNSTTLVTFPHVLFGAFLTGGVFVVGVSAWHLARRRETVLFGKAMRYGLVVSLIAAIGVSVSGDLQARIMTKQQPMKMAAAEALYTTSAPASFSLFTIGSLDGSQELWSVRAPHVLSFMATGDPNGKVEGIDDLQKAYEAKYGPGSYKPVVPVTYWSFRLMIGFGFLAGLLALAGLWFQRRGSRWFHRAALASMALPFLANTMGWIFTEIGRQPWTVFGVLRTKDGVSPGVGLGSVVTSLTVFTLLYAALAVIAGVLMVRYVRSGPPSEEETTTEEPLPAFSY
ncbi:cytochrome ubiquinol oxidase subunit I [Actinoallomurus rhizosphaericola]|uniref:cytochrome ubiquinol oxidase subunit I n=1 Tax=Actinoallomurus rhizosphaericola TaxID=2952536 RepID=UPI002092AA17|nr:cytochrome ubiquinol oxidase subunit I [Actinoallomurus rhizosphaericola]MCO5999752.1 cytochrome ubiquinol oxidase subunit I [Actinoallomurus rhizosphaericola]